MSLASPVRYRGAAGRCAPAQCRVLRGCFPEHRLPQRSVRQRSVGMTSTHPGPRDVQLFTMPAEVGLISTSVFEDSANIGPESAMRVDFGPTLAKCGPEPGKCHELCPMSSMSGSSSANFPRIRTSVGGSWTELDQILAESGRVSATYAQGWPTQAMITLERLSRSVS